MKLRNRIIAAAAAGVLLAGLGVSAASAAEPGSTATPVADTAVTTKAWSLGPLGSDTASLDCQPGYYIGNSEIPKMSSSEPGVTITANPVFNAYATKATGSVTNWNTLKKSTVLSLTCTAM